MCRAAQVFNQVMTGLYFFPAVMVGLLVSHPITC